MTEATAARRKGRAAILGILLVVALLAGLFGVLRQRDAGRPAAAALPVLNVGSQRGGTKALMIAAGVLDGVPYRIEWSEFPAAQHLLEALAAGAIDIGGAGDAPFLFAFAGGSPIKAVSVGKLENAGASVAIIVPQDSPIRTVADLRGKRIATGRVSAGHHLVLRALARAHLKPGDVTLTYLAPGDAKAAFSSGSVDAWATWVPFLSAALLHDKVRIVTDGTGLVAGEGYQVASEAAIAGKHAEIADFLARLARAYLWAKTHQAEFAQSIQRETGLPADVAAHFAAAYRPIAEPVSPAVVANARQVLDDFAAAGAIRSARPVEAAFDTSFNGTVAK